MKNPMMNCTNLISIRPLDIICNFIITMSLTFGSLSFQKNGFFLPFLMTISFLFIGSVDAFRYNIKATNPISETVLDLLISILIPVVILINVERSKPPPQSISKKTSIAKWLIVISFLCSLVGLGLTACFCYIAYN